MKPILFFIFFFATSLYAQDIKPFDLKTTPPPPDYSDAACWAALPDKKDNADLVPGQCPIKDLQSTANADVFFITPTIFTDIPKGQYQWNADVYDPVLNKKIDESTLKYQASIFNAAGKVYAPYYREAHLRSYFTKDKYSASQAFEIAYTDVRKAFEYYMAHYNNGRPVIIAAHSQGTQHARRLLTEFFDGRPYQKQLVVAYLVGFDISSLSYETLHPCKDSSETGCFVSWRTYSTTYTPPINYTEADDVVCTNPLTWKMDSLTANCSLNKGAVLKNFDKVIAEACDATIDHSILRIHKPNVRGKVFLRIKNYHVIDYNLFYMNVRINAMQRVDAYLKK